MIGGTQNYASNSSFPDLPCPCGAGFCLILTAKTGKNVGQQFYRCPLNQVRHSTKILIQFSFASYCLIFNILMLFFL